jgi:mandelate racemase
MIAVSGLDMAAWDALAKAADLPLAVHLGGSLAPVPAYHSGGLWLTPLERLAKEAQELAAEGGFRAVSCGSGVNGWTTTSGRSRSCARRSAPTSS